MNTYKPILNTLAILLAVVFSSSVMAVPKLQLGPGSASDPNWTYDTTDETWIYSGTTNNATLAAYALDGAFQSLPRTAYLSVAATPKTSDATDVFDITVKNNGVSLSMFESGHGAPPISDSNLLDNDHHDLSSHGIFDTYFEVYAFTFDESFSHIPNTEDGSPSHSDGWRELFNISVNSVDPAVTGLHFDLYTLKSDNNVYKFAPYSHDAGMDIPEPTPLVLSGL